jgi:hypothetical protein
MPKHLLFGMTLRHLTGSAVIVTMINRFGQYTSYSRLLELKTAMCKIIDGRDSIIPPTIDPLRNVVTHLCWDNFDLREETPSGSGTTHIAHGIVIQETSNSDSAPLPIILETLPKTKERSISMKPVKANRAM